MCFLPSFLKRASITLSADAGVVVTGDDARTLLGMPIPHLNSIDSMIHTATSYIYSDHFDEWNYAVDAPQPILSQLSGADADPSSVSFDIPLNTLIECLNIYGSPSMSAAGSGSSHRKWRREGDRSDDERYEERRDGRQQARGTNDTPANSRIDQYFGGGSDKRTRMRLSYGGIGHPLTLWL